LEAYGASLNAKTQDGSQGVFDECYDVTELNEPHMLAAFAELATILLFSALTY
jgi:hypothetical protein